MPSIFLDVYKESVGIGGLHYISMGLGLTLASQANARLLDQIYIYFKNKNGGVGEPEFRLRTFYALPLRYFLMPFVPGIASTFVGAALLPIGLLISGWAAQAGVHWAVTDLVSWLSWTYVISVVHLMLNGLLRG